jgi:hypothetical protein
MGPITYSLCQKPLIGPVMWITSLCAFPPLFSNESITLSTLESSVSKSFTVPVDKKYPLAVTFEFESVEARRKDEIVGNTFNESCNDNVRYEEIPEGKRAGLGRPIPFKVIVRKAVDQSVVLERTFVSLCETSSDSKNRKTRTIGLLELPRGEYSAVVTNLQAQPGMERVKTYISLYGGSGK